MVLSIVQCMPSMICRSICRAFSACLRHKTHQSHEYEYMRIGVNTYCDTSLLKHTKYLDQFNASRQDPSIFNQRITIVSIIGSGYEHCFALESFDKCPGVFVGSEMIIKCHRSGRRETPQQLTRGAFIKRFAPRALPDTTWCDLSSSTIAVSWLVNHQLPPIARVYCRTWSRRYHKGCYAKLLRKNRIAVTPLKTPYSHSFFITLI